MIIAIPKETQADENRVAITPDIVAKFKNAKFEIRVEKNAGLNAGFSDQDYIDAGAEIKDNFSKVCKDSNIICKIWAPNIEEEKHLKSGQIIIANFQALSSQEQIYRFANLGLTCFALDLMPRISRAQSMDILSSQSNLAGYQAVIEAVNHLSKAVPMMMTAAGTIAPAKVLVLGVGVAGLQAIATAKRLGAQVFASDVRIETREQVQSLGAKFVESNEVAEQLKKTDIAITTALVAGKKAPILINQTMLDEMPKGAVIIDMASSAGGNVEGKKEGINIIGDSNLASKVPNSASLLFAKNIFSFIGLGFNFEDEIIVKTCVCKEGRVL